MAPSARLLTISRPSVSAAGESVLPAERMPTKADAHNVTVTSAAGSAAASPRVAGGRMSGGKRGRRRGCEIAKAGASVRRDQVRERCLLDEDAARLRALV